MPILGFVLQRRTEVERVADAPLCREAVPSFYFGVISRRLELEHRQEQDTPTNHQ